MSDRVTEWSVPGRLVALPLGPRARPLDAFWSHGPKRNRSILLVVHGMGGNFYRSVSKKEMMAQAPRRGLDVLSFNNRGHERDVAIERFRDCLADIDAAIAFATRRGYRRVVLLGHSTGCQKIVYYQSVRRHPAVAALVLAAIGDDYAIARRDLGRRYAATVRRARALVARGRGDTILTETGHRGFAARRFLSVADPREIEARLFDFSGPMREFRRIATPTLAVLPEREEYACLPVPEMAAILRERARANPFACTIVPGANHSFHGCEPAVTREILDWILPLLKQETPR